MFLKSQVLWVIMEVHTPSTTATKPKRNQDKVSNILLMAKTNMEHSSSSTTETTIFNSNIKRYKNKLRTWARVSRRGRFRVVRIRLKPLTCLNWIKTIMLKQAWVAKYILEPIAKLHMLVKVDKPTRELWFHKRQVIWMQSRRKDNRCSNIRRINIHNWKMCWKIRSKRLSRFNWIRINRESRCWSSSRYSMHHWLMNNLSQHMEQTKAYIIQARNLRWPTQMKIRWYNR